VKQPALVSEKIHDSFEQPILVIDKEGIIGEELVKKLKNEGLVVYVSKTPPDLENDNNENIIHIPFLKKVPTIPENNYSHIFLIDDNDVLREAAISVLKKAESDHSVFIFISSLLNYNEKIINGIKEYYKNTKIIIYGDIIGQSLIEKRNSLVNKLIYEAKKYGKIEIPGDGTKPLYPLYISDLSDQIIEAVFGTHSNDTFFYLFPKEGITFLSFSHLLQKNYPWIKIDFVKEKKENKVKIPSWEGNYAISKKYSLEKSLKKISFEENAVFTEKKKIKKDKKIYKEKKGRNFYIFTAIFFLLFLLLMPLISTFSMSFLGITFLKNAKENFTNGNIDTALKQAEISKKTFSYASTSIKPLEYELSFIGKKEYAKNLSKDIETGKNISSSAISFFNASRIFLNVLNGKEETPREKFNKGINLLKDTITILQKEKNNNNLVEDFDIIIEKSLNFVTLTIDMWPTLMGFDDKKTYLVLLQNNMELRPGGGFIGSYGLLTLDKGKVLDFQINDVYDADGQLKAHIEPQFAIRRYLREKHLFLRDSNFDLDFRKTASLSALLFNLETGKKVDGVLGVDLSFVKNLLSATGEIDVLDYNEKVNSENLFYVTESHVEKGFFPGSTQKKDFLRSLYKAILTKFSDKKNISYFKLLEEAVKSIEEKHLLFAFNNPSIQNLFTVNNWSATLWDERKDSNLEINDYIGINEANLGANKVNYFISRSLAQRVEITDEGEVKEELIISYKNTSDGKWPGGDYKNYLRIILPFETKIDEITIDGEKQKIVDAIKDVVTYEKDNFKKPEGLEVEKTEDQQKAIYAFLVTVPKEKLTKISVKYTLFKKVDMKNSSVNYNLKLVKQPGIDAFPYDLLIKYPTSYQFFEKTEELSISDNEALLVKNIVKDENIVLSLTKK